MKKYKSTGVTGRAGELYFAYWIVRYFNWPCRLLDIDVGIDAQVEIFEDEISTGDFFAVQIKSTVGNTPDIQIDKSDFIYWQQLETQVVLVSIVMADSHNEPEMFWKPFSKECLDEIVQEIISKGQQSKKVTFTDSDKLCVESKNTWRMAMLSESDKDLIRLAESLLYDLEQHDLDNFVEEDYYLQDEHKDYVTFNSEIDIFNHHFIDYEELKDSVSHDRRLVLRAPLIEEAIDYFENNEATLLYMFNHAFNRIKGNVNPNEILPQTLSREIRRQTKDWVYQKTSY